MSRLQRVFAFAGLVGTGFCLLGTLLFTTAGPNEVGKELTAFLIWALSFLLIFFGLVGWGAGYLKSQKSRLGAALIGAPVLTGVLFSLSIAGIEFASAGRLLLIIPTSVMTLVVGYDLWTDTDVSDDS